MDPVPAKPAASRVHRILCGLGLHRDRSLCLAEVADPDDPCRREWRCAHCAWRRSVGPIHEFGPETIGEDPCRRTETCVRCGYQRRTVAHRTRRVLVSDLPSSEPSEHAIRWPAEISCDAVEVCQDCDYTSSVEADHDWDNPRWGDVCRRCGEKWVGSEA